MFHYFYSAVFSSRVLCEGILFGLHVLVFPHVVHLGELSAVEHVCVFTPTLGFHEDMADRDEF